MVLNRLIMEGYKFTTEKKAIKALKSVNDTIKFYEGGTTTTWTSYSYAEENSPKFYFISSDPYTDTILKGKETFEVIYSDI